MHVRGEVEGNLHALGELVCLKQSPTSVHEGQSRRRMMMMRRRRRRRRRS